MDLKAAGGVVPLELPGRDVFLMGYGPGASRAGRYQRGSLRLRCIVLEDAAGRRTALLSGDFWSGSAAVLKAIARRLPALQVGLRHEDLFFSGTHTHSSLGGINQSGFYEQWAAAGHPESGFDSALAEAIAAQFAALITDTCTRLEPADLSVGTGLFRGYSINRSYEAYLRNFPQVTNPDLSEERQREAITAEVPLVRLTARGTTRVLGVWGTVSCHGTVLPKANTRSHADLLGTASALLEASRPGQAPWVLCCGAVGDVDPQPPGLSRAEYLAERNDLAACFRRVNELARALADVVSSAQYGPATSAADVSCHHSYPLVPGLTAAGVRMPASAQIGASTLAGSELGRGCGGREGTVAPFQAANPHSPKAETGVTAIANAAFDSHDNYFHLSLVKLGQLAWLVGVSGEPTTMLASRIRERLEPLARGARVVVCGLNGNYGGYFVTEQEYMAQHYEGASCIWGRFTERALLNCLEQLARGALVPLRAPRAARTRRSQPTGLTIVERPAPHPDARLEFEFGSHRSSVGAIDARRHRDGWRLSFVVDSRLLPYQGRLVLGREEVGPWQVLREDLVREIAAPGGVGHRPSSRRRRRRVRP